MVLPCPFQISIQLHRPKNNKCTLFNEDGPGYKGKRLFITKAREEKNTDLLESLRRRKTSYEDGADRFLVYFTLDKELPLVGEGD